MGGHRVLDDLEHEYLVFDRTLAALPDDGWSGSTLCGSWDVRDVLCHLWLQAGVALDSVAGDTAILDTLPRDSGQFDAWVDQGVRDHAHVPGPEVWRGWRERRAALVAALRSHPDDARIRWTVGELSPSMLGTVLTMETWTHHYDVRTPLGLEYGPTPAVRDVAFMAWKTLPWAVGRTGGEYRPVRFELDGPAGERWTFGPDDVDDVVRGDAVELCLVAVQRKPLAEAATIQAEGAGAQLALRSMRCFV